MDYMIFTSTLTQFSFLKKKEGRDTVTIEYLACFKQDGKKEEKWKVGTLKAHRSMSIMTYKSTLHGLFYLKEVELM